ncbi:MAG: methionine adenosyltransferase domain-containing protein [Prevotellaceae bacterium]|nr:methionine adenosyltransferase domain-containing protein [Prevotellaceae bacterium]
MIKTAEYVSLGHPDKVADFISEYLLDRYITIDPKTRYAVEVQIKGNFVSLSGEVSAKEHFTSEEIAQFVREAIAEIGYTREYQGLWGKENVIAADDVEVVTHISRQSPDIAQGVNRQGWGDQGIFFGYANRSEAQRGMPYEHWLARQVCHGLFAKRLGGIDIKTQVVTEDGIDKRLIIAIPLKDAGDESKVIEYARCFVPDGCEITVNGTGRYVQHGPIADCGTTGRKLAVDFYGGACRIGGGSPWTKDGTKADLTLNLYARELARKYAVSASADEVYTSLACCIGRDNVHFSACDEKGRELGSGMTELRPQELIERYGLDKPVFASLCSRGLFGVKDEAHKWE